MQAASRKNGYSPATELETEVSTYDSCVQIRLVPENRGHRVLINSVEKISYGLKNAVSLGRRLEISSPQVLL
jgi:hypothetical protein